MNKRHKERLLKLADFLEKVPKAHFNLGHWTSTCSDDTLHALATKFRHGQLENHGCGVTACAVGWLPVVFPRSFVWRNGRVESTRGNGLNGCAARYFFGLNHEQSDYLFMPNCYRKGRRGPKSVANRIRSFVKNDGRVPPHNVYFDVYV